MDKMNQYRQHIKNILEYHCHLDSKIVGMERYTAFDTAHDHYQVISVGWDDGQRLYGCLIHVDIKDEEIWIQYDGTEYSIAQELINLGVSPQSIVVAYQAPSARKFTEFAIK
jgi:XisI protein